MDVRFVEETAFSVTNHGLTAGSFQRELSGVVPGEGQTSSHPYPGPEQVLASRGG